MDNGLVSFKQSEIPDGRDAGIASIDFAFGRSNNTVAFHCSMEPDDDVIDADEGDFPSFDCILTREQFRSLYFAMKQFDEEA